jgi:pilus assembly protein Flp/PilA
MNIRRHTTAPITQLNKSFVISKRPRRFKPNEIGQGMTEYILIVAVVAVLSIGALTAFSNQLQELFAWTTNMLGGDDTVQLQQIDTSNTINKKLGD